VFGDRALKEAHGPRVNTAVVLRRRKSMGLSVVVHACNPGSQEAEAEGLGVPILHYVAWAT
jgi:hypothetical protein